MSRATQIVLLGAAAALLCLAPAWAQWPSEVVGFNDNPDVLGSFEMFRIPEFSPTTLDYILVNDPPASYNNNNAWRSSQLKTEGAGGMNIYFRWVNPADPDGWVRVTTWNGAERPNPSLHVDGKVRFKLINRSEYVIGTFGICLGIRETGVAVPQLADGGSNGDIEWFGVDTTPNGIIAGPDGIVNTTADPLSDDVQEYPVGYNINDPNNPLPTGTAVISPGPDEILQTVPVPDDEVRFGYFIGANGNRRPIPAITLAVNLPPAPQFWTLEWDMTAGTVSVGGAPQTCGTAGFTGNGVLDVTPRRGTLEHIAFTNLTTDTAVLIDVGIDELQFEAPEPDPVLPPRVVWPIIDGDPTVTVTDLQTGVNQVNLLLNGDPYLSETVTTMDDVVFTLTSPAETGDYYTATQRVGTETSPESDPVYVLPSPPPYTFSVLIDEGGTGSCTTAYGWEFAGATSVEVVAGKWAPLGYPVFTDDARWQAVNIPFNVVAASPYGDGVLGASPNGVYTMDSTWFTLADPNAASDPNDPNNPIYWEVFIDGIQLLDEFGQPGEMIMDFEDGVRRFIFPRGQSPDELNYEYSNLSTMASYDGSNSHRFEWYYDGIGLESLGFLQRTSTGCGTATEFSELSSGLRFHMLLRGQPTAPGVPLPQVLGPVIGDQTGVRVINDASATSVSLYVDGGEVASLTPSGTTTDFTGLSLQIGESVSAKQELPGPVVSDFAYPRGVSGHVAPPTVLSPIIPQTTTVTVNDVIWAPFAQADTVTVYVRDPNDVLLGTYSETPTGDSVDVTVPALQNGEQVSAAQTVNTLTSPESERVTVEFRTPMLHHLPAEGDTEVKVLLVYETATATVTLRDLGNVVVGTWSGSPDPGEEYVDITVSGLVAGYTMTAMQTAGGVDSAESPPDTVTVSGLTDIFVDTMELYNTQDDFENEYTDPNRTTPIPADTGWWPSSGDPGLILDFTKNSTVGGDRCVYAPGEPSPPGGFYDGWRSNHDFAWRINPIPPAQPTDTEPLIWSFALYDTEGPGVDLMNQWASLMDYSTGSLGALLSVGETASEWGGWTSEDYDGDYYHARILWSPGPDYVNLNEVEAPMRSKGWHMFTMVIKPNSIDFYVDGKLSKKNVPRDDAPYDNLFMGAGYRPLHAAYYDDFRVQQGKVIFHPIEPQAPPAPDLVAPVEEGDATVTVTGIAADAILVRVYANAVEIGNAVPDPNDPTVDVPVIGLIHLDSITAKQENVVDISDASEALEVGKGNGDVLVCIGIRETGDTGPLGSEGSTSGTYPIEWVGASGVVNGAPQGVAVSLSDAWQTLTFDLTDPNIIVGFSGDGVIDGTRGTLEHLAVTVNAASPDRSSGTYHVYVDNVVNVGAGAGGSDFVITDFEAFAVGAEVLFQEPTYSGSTDVHLAPLPSASEVSGSEGNPGQSELLVWFFKDTTDQRWARITTAAASNVPSPIIDLTKPIRLDLLVAEEAEGCPNPGAHRQYCTADVYPNDGNGSWDYAADGDCRVSLQDLAQLLAHYGQTGVTHEDGDVYPENGDGVWEDSVDGDGAVTLADLAAMLAQYNDNCN